MCFLEKAGPLAPLDTASAMLQPTRDARSNEPNYEHLIMFHSDDDISLFVSFFDIPVSLGNLFQRIASIYDRSYLSCLNNLFDEDQIFSLFACWPQACGRKPYLLTTCD